MKKQPTIQLMHMAGNTIQRTIAIGLHPAHLHHQPSANSEAGSSTKKSPESLYHPALQPTSGTSANPEKTGSKSEAHWSAFTTLLQVIHADFTPHLPNQHTLSKRHLVTDTLYSIPIRWSTRHWSKRLASS